MVLSLHSFFSRCLCRPTVILRYFNRGFDLIINCSTYLIVWQDFRTALYLIMLIVLGERKQWQKQIAFGTTALNNLELYGNLYNPVYSRENKIADFLFSGKFFMCLHEITLSHFVHYILMDLPGDRHSVHRFVFRGG